MKAVKLEPSVEDRPARFLVGIDLGTTNCAVAYVDTAQAEPHVRDFPISQVVAPDEVEVRDVLPSFSYAPASEEFTVSALPKANDHDGKFVVGFFAREHGAQVPGRLIASAKSWLSHPGVDRTAALLPWHGAPDVVRVSPVEASARYLEHIRRAWENAFPGQPLAEQEVTVTVPASFDEVARTLTVQAAERAGLPHITLLEEPQAAFYAWMAGCGAVAEQAVRPGQLTLICDVGGGTSDFTLIEARAAEQGGVRFHRVAVGEHLILGGDNMDLALAHHVESRLPGGGRLDPRRWGLLVQSCRTVKETLLAPQPPDRLSVHVAGGARLIGGALQVEVTREEVQSVLLDGFFPRVPLEAKPAVRSGFQEFGLPYAADAAITRHLAAFLTRHATNRRPDEPGAPFPDRLLFNGGVFESPLIRERLLAVLEDWRQTAQAPDGPALEVLPNDRLDLAVARGSAYAALLRRQHGRRIAAGLARAYYVQVGREAAKEPATVCLAPAGLEEGHPIVLPQRFALRIRQPVEFALFSSSTRLQDRAGDLVAADPAQLTPLPPVRTVVKSGRSSKASTAEVQLHARLSEIGTLDVRCVEPEGQRSWKLEFDVRGSKRGVRRVAAIGAPMADGAIEEATVEAARDLVLQTYQAGDRGITADPARLVKQLEEATALPRDQWPLPLLRALWETLLEVEPGRRLSLLHETRWLNLLGFSLRPGYGFTVDDWRVQQTWKLFFVGTVFPKNELCRAEWLILWRRIAGGLSAGQQRALAEPCASLYRPKGGRKLHRGLHETAETWRLLGALELLGVELKLEIAEHLAHRLERKLEPPVLQAAWWAFGRLGARVSAYGPLNALVPTETVEDWLSRIIARPPAHAEALFTAVQMARATGDRYRDIAEETRAAVLAWLRQHDAPEHYLQLVREGGQLDQTEEQQAFGETLPPGLHLENE